MPRASEPCAFLWLSKDKWRGWTETQGELPCPGSASLCLWHDGSYTYSRGWNHWGFRQTQGNLGWGEVVKSGSIFFIGFSMSHNSFRFTAHIWPPSRSGSFHPWCRLGEGGEGGSGKLIKADWVVKENQSSPALDQVDENHSPWFSINWNKA